MLIKNKNRIDKKKKEKKTSEISIKHQCATFSEKQEVITRGGFLSDLNLMNLLRLMKKFRGQPKIPKERLINAVIISYDRLSKPC